MEVCTEVVDVLVAAMGVTITLVSAIYLNRLMRIINVIYGGVDVSVSRKVTCRYIGERLR